MAQHLANLTGAPVGGFPPNKPWDARDFNHWRAEIQAFIENIRKARLSPRQLLRELKKQTHLSEEQIKDTLQKLKAAGFDDLFPSGQSPSQGRNRKG